MVSLPQPLAPLPLDLGPLRHRQRLAALPLAAPLQAAPARVQGKDWELHDHNSATGAIVDAIQGAKLVVNAEFFGFTDAGKGAKVTSALVDAARRGVEVNVIVDSASMFVPPFGSFHRMRRKVEDAGGTVIVTTRNPLSPRAKASPGLKHVDHRKVVTVDGTTGFVGGMNFVPLTDEYHDTMIRLSGVSAARLGADQLDRWNRVGGKVTDRHSTSVSSALGGRPTTPTDRRELSVIANAPEQERFEITNGYRDLIRNARKRIWISSPGISDRQVMGELRAAAERGVDVRIVAPGKAPLGVPMIAWVGRAHLKNLTTSGGAGYEIPEILHRKAIVADDEVILSSYNLTGRSRKHDHEVGLRTSDPDFVKAIAATLESDMTRAAKFDADAFTGIGARIGGFIADRITY